MIPRPSFPKAVSLFFLVLPLLSSPVWAALSRPDVYYETLYKNAETSLDKKDVKKADFWIARFLGEAFLDEKSSKGPKDVAPLLKKRRLLPNAFISGNFDTGFLDWFVRALYARWGVGEDRVRERQRTFEIEGATYKKEYFVTVTASPLLESWFVMQNGIASREEVLTLGSFKERPVIFFGKLFAGAPSAEFQSLDLAVEHHSLHYFWKPEFFDVDQDGVPELWLRYNLTWGNGFSQILEIYRINSDNQLELIQRFRGEHEGFARRLPDGQVEVGSGFASHSDLAQMSYDSDRVETWEYSKKDHQFGKISEKTIPNILLSSAWREYFLEPGSRWDAQEVKAAKTS